MKNSRRDLLKGTAAAGVLASTGLGTSAVVGQVVAVPTPYVTPFKDPLFVPAIKVSEPMHPECAKFRVEGECGRDPHQVFDRFPPSAESEYIVNVGVSTHRFHSELPLEQVWTYDGTIPGPTFVERSFTPTMVRFINNLPEDHKGFGSPEISTHLHGAHVGSESDGYAGNYYSREDKGPTISDKGAFYDNHYPNYPSKGDPRNICGTMWYHDHREEFTAPNVYRGLAGMYLVFDEIDSGNENDPNPKALRLPSGVGKYDIPLVVQDKKFDVGGNLVFNQLDPEGFLGNLMMVNGTVSPYLKVEGRKYRFRLLDASMARYFQFHLHNEAGKDQEFHFIASDGNLLERPVKMTKLFMGMAERSDIIIDFGKYPPGTKLYLVNRLEQTDPRKPSGSLLNKPVRLMRFDIGEKTTDSQPIPAFLRALPPMPTNIVRTRRWELGRKNGQWTINDKFFDPERVDAVVKHNQAEIWKFDIGGGWAHPIHIHLDDFRILSYDGRRPPPEWAGRKDVIPLLPGVEMSVLVMFTDYVGKYMMHCHQTAHEDSAMMIRYDVVKA
ncbi:multicopper oxidase domain-containing protein [Massilia sp. CMS3.1]|uniref:multicopper oxidase domain-containing protein n=1 Tax=Massilia sp. CMS3.1 TaxID=3373083 RepID=UPI003EE546E7